MQSGNMPAQPYSGQGQSFTDRIMGAGRLDVRTYEEVEHDTSATTQAAIVVGIAAIAGAIGGANEGIEGIIAGLLASLLGWVVSAGFIYIVGTKLLPSARTEADLGQVLRCVGFAAVPGFLNILGFIPVIGFIVAFVVLVWNIMTNITAIKTALEMSTLRAIAVAIIAVILSAIVLGVIYAIFGIDIA